ncbi:MAG: radical SAM protein [Promethearchaeota archaeon]|jgi:putative pyruvate formate lyase activating enzyme
MVFRILRPDSESVWQNSKILNRFSRYKGIIDGIKAPRYLIAKTIDSEFDSSDSIENLETLLKEKSLELNEVLKKEFDDIKYRGTASISYIHLAEFIATKYLENCIFCERKCEVNRINGQKGFCLINKDSYVTSAFLHMGEEAPLIPSGTIFFQGCNFGCIFCQNYDISQSWKGKRDLEDIAQKVTSQKLASIAEKLTERGAININYVGGDPIPNIHTIIGSLKYQTSNITQLWNSNLYLTDKALSLIIDLIDVWLPDWKYGNNDCARKYSGIDNYFNIISRNHKRIHDEGSGEIIIRHLVMPNHIECCSKPILKYVSEELPKAVVNIMKQFRPEYEAYKFPEINRRLTSNEMQEVKKYAKNLGVLFKPVS